MFLKMHGQDRKSFMIELIVGLVQSVNYLETVLSD